MASLSAAPFSHCPLAPKGQEHHIASLFENCSRAFLAPPDFHGKCAAVIGRAADTDFSTGQINHPLHQRQSQAVALGGVAGIALIEFVEDVLRRFRGDSAAGVPHGNRCVFVLGLHRYRDAAALRGKFDGVRQEIVPDQRQKLGIGRHQDAVIHFALQVDVLALQGVIEGKQTIRHLLHLIWHHQGHPLHL